MSAPERIWTDWKAANDACVAFDEPPANEDEGYRDAYILVTAHEAAVAAAREREREIWVSAICTYFDATAVMDVENYADRIREEASE